MENLKGVIENYPDVVQQQIISNGCVRIEHYKVDKEAAKWNNIRAMMAGAGFMHIVEGEYIKMSVNGELMMSDTPMERRTNIQFIDNAHGAIMIAGLGIGVILENLIPLCKSGRVTNIVVYEKYQDVIDLVAHRYVDKLPLEVRCEDIMEYRPPKEEKYDTLYFDIWPTITEDNLKDIRILHNRWKSHKKEGAWMGSWMADFLRNQRRKEQRESRSWW